MATRTDENRFAYLLEPIRDLAQNWNIDLARELEDYLAELETISIAFDGSSGHTLNFAEAALLIQGSACIYSKKVEYLYSLLYSTLDALIKKKHKRNRAASSVGPDGIDMDAIFDNDDPILSDFGSALRQRNNVDLDVDAEEPYAKLRKSQLVIRPPLSLISVEAQTLLPSTALSGTGFKMTNLAVHGSGALLLEERDRSLVDPVSRTDVSTHTLPSISSMTALASASHGITSTMSEAGPFGSPRAVFARASLSPAVAHRLSLTGGRLSVAQASAVAESGRRSSRVFATVDDAMSTSSVSHSLFEELSQAAEPGAEEAEPSALADVDDQDDEVLPDYQHFGVDGGIGAQGELTRDVDLDQDTVETTPESILQPSVTTPQSVVASQQTTQASQQPESQNDLLPFEPEEENDPWERLDPYEEVGNPKPFRKGRTYVKPKPNTDAEASLPNMPTSIEAQKLASALSHDPLEEMVRKNIAKGSIHVPYYAEFASAYLRNLVVRKRVAKRAKSVLATQPPVLAKLAQAASSSSSTAQNVVFASPSRSKDTAEPVYDFVSSLAENATQGESQPTSGLSTSTVGMLTSASTILGSSTAAAAAASTAIMKTSEGSGLLDEALAAHSAAAEYETDDLDEGDAGQVLFDLGAISSAADTGLDGAGAVEARDLWEEAAGGLAEEHAQEDFASVGFDAEAAQITKTYEELCREHVEQYLASSARYINESALVKRVNEWQRELEPLLAEEAARKPFDIQAYGGEIIYRMQKITLARQEGQSVDAVVKSLEEIPVKAEDDASPVAKLEVDYKEAETELKSKLKIDENGVPEERVEVKLPEILSGRTRYDVCRAFLATLQLANNGNIDIFYGESPEDPTAVGGRTTRSGREMNAAVAAAQLAASSKDQIANPENVTVKLLTTRRNYVEDAILAPSDTPFKEEDPSTFERFTKPVKQTGAAKAAKGKRARAKPQTKRTKRATTEESEEEEEFDMNQYDEESDEPVESASSNEEEEEEAESPQTQRKRGSKKAANRIASRDVKLGQRRGRSIQSDSESDDREDDHARATAAVQKRTTRVVDEEEDEEVQEDEEEMRKRMHRRKRA